MTDSPEYEGESWTATLVPERRPEAKRKRRSRRAPRYEVVLWDDDFHSFEYVEQMLRELFGHSPEECHRMALTVHIQGKVVVLTTTKEHAELKRDQIHAYGKDHSIRACQGSMYASVEAVE